MDGRILPGCPFVVRLDGVAFKSLTAHLQKPFDPSFTQAMLRTAAGLMAATVARTAFVQSDEISLVFGPEPSLDLFLYGGRVQKIASTLASLAAAHFNKQPAEPTTTTRLGHFDARVFSVPDSKGAEDALYWRHRWDCRRNAINMIGSHHLRHAEMQGLSMGAVIGRLRERHGVDPFKDYSPLAVYGAFIKRIQAPHLGWNPITKQSVPTQRIRLEARTFDWSRNENTIGDDSKGDNTNDSTGYHSDDSKGNNSIDNRGDNSNDRFVLSKLWEPGMPESIIPISLLEI